MMDKARMVLRFYIGLEDAEMRFSYLHQFLRETGIRRVILFTGSFLEEKTILPLSYYEAHAHMLETYIPRLREMGVEVGINMLNTIGHIFFGDDPEDSRFHRAVDLDGNVSNGNICLLDQNLHSYVKKQYSIYAALHPSVIFIDDDIRNIKMNNVVCLCDEHIRVISELYGQPLSREQIRAAILSDEFEVHPVRQIVTDVFRRDNEHITKVIADAIHEISPETELGTMTVEFPSATFDRDLSRLASSGISRLRPGMNFYREGEVKEIPMAFANPLIQRNLIANPSVELQPEIENDPYTLFYNSRAKTHMQVVWCLSNGLRNMQLNLFESLGEIPDFSVYKNLFKENMPYYNALTELVPEGKRAEGVGIYRNKDSLLHRRVKGKKSMEALLYPNYWYRWMSLLGLPVGYDWDITPFLFLTGDDVLGATPEELEKMLCRGAVLDLSAAQDLVYLGFGERIGIQSIVPIKRAFAGERFTDHPINGKFAGVHNSYYFHSGLLGPEDVQDIQYLRPVQELSTIVDVHREKLASGVVLTENDAGERFCIMPVDAGLFQQFNMVNYKRKHQLSGVLEWIARQELPVLSLHANLCVNVNQFAERTVLALFNINNDALEEIQLKYRLRGELKVLQNTGVLEPVGHKIEETALAVLTAVEPMGCLILVDEHPQG